MLKSNKGQVGAVLIFLLPFILIFAFFLLSAAVISMLKLPLALIGAVLVFLFLPDVFEERLDIKGKYALAISGVVSALVGFVIYKMSLFWLIVVLGILFVLNYALEQYFGVSPGKAIKKVLKEVK